MRGRMFIPILAGIFSALLVYAACHDVFDRTIPNWVSILITILFLPAAYIAQLSPEQFGWHALVSLIALIVGIILFYLRIWGGGDAKLVAATSLWMGVSAAPTFLAAFAIAGGIIALPLIIVRRMKFEPQNDRLAKMLDVKKVPYGVAIAVGAFWAAPQSVVLAQAINAIGASQ